MIKKSVFVLVAFLAVTACSQPQQEKVETTTSLQQQAKDTQFVKDNTTKVLVDTEIKQDDIVRVVQHGDHWHVFTKDGKEHITYVNPDITSNSTLSLISVVPLSQLRNMDVVSIEVHGDHWHVKTRDGEEYLTYEDPSGLFTQVTVGQYQGGHGTSTQGKQNGQAPDVKTPSENTAEKTLDIVKIAKHGDHYHVYTRDGQEFVVYSNPRALYPNAEYVEYAGSHANHGMSNNAHGNHHDDHKHDDHDDHDDHKHDDHDDHGDHKHDDHDDHDDHKHDDHDHDHGEHDKNGKNNTGHGGNGNDGENSDNLTPPKLNIVKVVSGEFLKTVDIDKILKHGDHYHVYTKDGKEYLSYDNLEQLFPHIIIKGYAGGHGDIIQPQTKEPVLAVKHGDHWHLYADLEGKEEVGTTKEDPRVKYPSIKVIEEHYNDHDKSHGTDTTHNGKDNSGADNTNKGDSQNEEPVLAKRHGDHWHLYADLEGKKEIGVVHEDPRKHYPNIKVEELETGDEHDGEVAHPDFKLSDNLIKKREELAKQMNVAVEDIRVIVSDGKVIGFEYPHEDHFHFVRVTDDAETSALTDDQKRELTAYLRKAYGLLLGTPVTFHKDFVVFAIPHPHQDYDVNRDYYSDVLDPNYDAGHVHPYVVPLATLRMPVVTGIPELDFENELIEAARRRGVAPSEVKIKDHKYFVLPGKDHDHYLNILTSSEGYQAYFNNKLPDITPSFVEGSYSKEDVVVEVQRILEEAKNQFKEGTVEYRRVARVLEAFEAKLSIPTTSTQGYIQALKAFENKYLKGIDDTAQESPEVNEFTQAYTALIEKLKTYDERTVSQYGIKPQELVTQLQGYVVAKDAQGLKEVEIHFAAIDRAKRASSDLAPRLAYMDYFVRNLDSDRLSASLRLEVINKLNELYKISGLYRNPQKFREMLKSVALLKERVKMALASNVPAPDHENWKPYPRGFYRKDIASTINSMRDFLIRNKEITEEELAEGFGKKLELFPVHPKKPKN